MTGPTIETPIQMRFADTDMLGHVNNVNLQHYFDMGKTDCFMRVLGMDMNWRKRGLVQKATQTTYEAQTFYPENIYVSSAVEKIGTTSLTFYQEIRNRDTGELKAVSRAVLVCFDFVAQTKTELPVEWKKALED